MLARIATAALLAAGWALAQATPPSLLSLQGRLTDNAGQPITSTQRDLRVEFWTLAVGGVSLGNSTVVDPTIANGIYAVTVTAPAGVFAANATVFMEMAVGSGAAGADGAFEVLSPRTRVLASAYALNADTLDGLDSSSFAQASNSFVQNGNSFGALATLGTNDAFDLGFETGGSERVRVDTTGRVGIGTSTPRAPLEIRRTSGGPTGIIGHEGAVLTLSSTGAAAGTQNNAIEMAVDGSDPGAGGVIEALADGNRIVRIGMMQDGAAANSGIMQFSTMNAGTDAERMRITSTGNVGIGNSNPDHQLVVGQAGGGRWLVVNDVPDARWGLATGGFDLSIQNDNDGTPDGFGGGAWTTRLVIAQDGSVGIGTTTPGFQLDVTSGAGQLAHLRRAGVGEPELFIAGGGFSPDGIILGGSEALLLAADAGTDGAAVGEVDMIIAGGNVGIGTTAPAVLLDVAGRLRYGFRQSVAGVATITFTGLDGNNDGVYEITMHGTLNSAGVNRTVRLGPNGDLSANYRNVAHRHMEVGGAGSIDTSIRNDGGLTIGFSDWNDSGDILITARLMAPTGRRRVLEATHSFTPTSFADRELQGRHIGWWSDTTTNITSLTISLTGGSFTGTVVLRTVQ